MRRSRPARSGTLTPPENAIELDEPARFLSMVQEFASLAIKEEQRSARLQARRPVDPPVRTLTVSGVIPDERYGHSALAQDGKLYVESFLLELVPVIFI